MFSYKANAQRVIKIYKEPISLLEQKPHQVSVQPAGALVSGKITTNRGQPVAYASVMINGTQLGTAADSNGVFSIRVPGINRSLEISAAGYKKQLMKITSSNSTVELEIKMSENILLDTVLLKSNSRRVTVGGARSSCVILSRSNEKKNDNIATASSISIFPNPARRNEHITIRFKKPVSNDQQILLYNTAGQLLQQKTISIIKSSSQVELTLNLNAPGHYAAHIIDVKTREIQNAQLIVE